MCSPEAGFDYLADLTATSSVLPNLRTIHLNASIFNNAGADIVQELAFGISMGSEYLTQLTERGIDAELASEKLRFSFATGSNYFMEIAKLRAVRLLWSAVINGLIVKETEKSPKMNIHCVTSSWNKTIYDPHVNMLRTQTEAMSAILGGADSLTVEPFDKVFRQPDEFSERIARNQQLILKEESYFDKVADPSAGSYYVENLTSLIADHGWKLFLEIEEKGGFLQCIRSGYIQNMLKETAEKKKNDVATRKRILLGTNQYPNTGEAISSTVDLNRVISSRTHKDDTDVDPVTGWRGSEDYDRLRIAVDRSSERPAVFLLPMGNPLMRKARSQFSAGFFGCAGYHIIDNNGFENVDDGVAAAVDSGADIVVICSSDEEYALFAPEIFRRMKDKAIIVIAGNPASIDELKLQGLENFIHIRSNVPETLARFNARLGIKM